MKKLICMLLALTMCLSVASCTQTPAVSSGEQTSVSSPSDELKALQDQILALQSEKDEMLNTLNEKTQKIDALTSEKDQLKEFKNTYEGLIETYAHSMSLLPYSERTKNLPKYEDGSLTLEPQTGWVLEPLGYRFAFDRKYRLSYYGINDLPLEKALMIVRGHAEEPTFLFDPVHHDIRNVEIWENYYGEPIMHYYSWFILAYQVSREEMEQIVELLSDPDSEAYRGWSEEWKGEIDFNHEFWELPNVDILYTFDANIINEYYRYA